MGVAERTVAKYQGLTDAEWEALKAHFEPTTVNWRLSACKDCGALVETTAIHLGKHVEFHSEIIVDVSECTCQWVDPSLWTTYGSAVEPGSQREPDPECPEHGQPHSWCITD